MKDCLVDSTGLSPWKNASNIVSQNVYTQESLASQASSSAEVVMINSCAGAGRTTQVPLLQKRPSVLFKKKVETAKQRMQRYIGRV